MKSGFVSIVGRPNVGKSTLLNALIEEHVAIVSNKPGTTRNIIQGIYNDEETQIVFIDTPGIHKPINKLGTILNKQAKQFFDEVDAVLFIVDASTGLGRGDKFILEGLKNNDVPIILILNKIDLVKDEDLYNRINEYKELFDFADIIPISAMKKNNVNEVVKFLKNYLTDDVRYFDVNQKTNNSKYFLISEYVREKLFNSMEEEIPHSITCVTTHFEEKSKIVNIIVEIIVERDSLKKIVIGKQGSRLKEVGSKARIDIEKLLGKKVFLELYVKTIRDWRNKEQKLSELGFNENM